MSAPIAKAPLIIDSKGKLHIPTYKPFANETELQETLAAAPSILPTAEIDNRKFTNLTLIGREIRINTTKQGKGKIDLLYISQTGHLVIVETKLWKNPEACREVIGQIFDYAANIQKWTYSDLSNVYKPRNLYKDIKRITPDIPDESVFIDQVNNNLKKADFLMMIVGDEIRQSLETVTDFLTARLDKYCRLALCEVLTYTQNNITVVMPRLTLSTKIIERTVLTDKVIEDIPKSSNTGSLKSFIKIFVESIPGITDVQISEFIADIEDSDKFLIDVNRQSISIKIKNFGTLLQLAPGRIFIDGHKLTGSVAHRNKNPKIVRDLFTALIPYKQKGKNDSNDIDSRQYLNKSVLTKNRPEFMEILNTFARNF